MTDRPDPKKQMDGTDPWWVTDPEGYEKFRREMLDSYTEQWERDYGWYVSSLQERLGLTRLEAMLYLVWHSTAAVRRAVEMNRTPKDVWDLQKRALEMMERELGDEEDWKGQ